MSTGVYRESRTKCAPLSSGAGGCERRCTSDRRLMEPESHRTDVTPDQAGVISFLESRYSEWHIDRTNTEKAGKKEHDREDAQDDCSQTGQRAVENEKSDDQSKDCADGAVNTTSVLDLKLSKELCRKSGFAS